MSASQVSGRFFKLDGSGIEVFGLEGSLEARNRWVIGILLNVNDDGTPNYVPFMVDPSPVAHRIEQIIQEDAQAGKADQIAYIGISSRYAVILFLEGRLTRQSFLTAVEADNEIRVKATFLGKEYDVVIWPEVESPVYYATFNQADQVV